MTASTLERPRRRGGVRRSGAGLWIGYALVVVYALTLILPLYWLLISAFKVKFDILTLPFVPNFSAGIDNFTKVWEILTVGPALLNSAYITLVSLALTIVLAVPAAYGLARARGRIGLLVERIYALGFLIPGFASLVPTLLLAIALHLFHAREFMILYLPASAQPLAVILLIQFMRTVPPELEESATIDGAGRLRILRSVYLPLIGPGVATVAILNFIGFWNDYLYTLIIVGVQTDRRTIQVAIPTLVDGRGITDYALLAAATVISVLPVFVVYIVLNRRMENALIQGALKG